MIPPGRAVLGALTLLAAAALLPRPAAAAIYWTTGGGTIGRADNRGFHVQPALVRSLALPRGLAVTRTNIFLAARHVNHHFNAGISDVTGLTVG